VRYAGWTTRDFERFPTYAYGDQRPDPAVQRVTMPAGVVGDAQKGRALFMNRSKGPCYSCHLVPGDDVWPAGSAGPDQSTLGDRKLPDQYLYQVVWDARALFPNTVMPPWGTAGIFSPEEIVDVVAYLQTLKGPCRPRRTRTAIPSRAPGPPASATTSIRRTTPRSCWPMTPRLCGRHAGHRARRVATATKAAWPARCAVWQRDIQSS
jgi:sulfur-oxidizing protein SoxA